MDNRNQHNSPGSQEDFNHFFSVPEDDLFRGDNLSMTQELDLENIIRETKQMDEQESFFDPSYVPVQAAPISAEPAPAEEICTPVESLPLQPAVDISQPSFSQQSAPSKPNCPQRTPQMVQAEVPASLFPEEPLENTTTLPSLEETANIPVIQEKKEAANPKRKVRPKAKKGPGLFGLPHLAASVIWLGILIFIGASLGRAAWLYAADLLAFGKNDNQCTITVTIADLKSEDPMGVVANKLKDAGLIRYPELFKIYAKITDAHEDLIPGTFTLRANNDYHALVSAMSPKSATRETVEIMIPEGYTCAQIFQLLDDNNVCSVQELETFCMEGNLGDYWFLDGVRQDNRYCLEGYLFPDTYQFYVHDEPKNVIAKFLNNFDYRFTDIMKDRLISINNDFAATLRSRGYNEYYIKEHEITIREVVIIASMIEKETANDSDSYNISSVIYNRLGNPGSFPYLNIDATIIYAMGGKKDNIDTSFDSPYNTYLNKGLPPGAISNPGRNSLNAALSPNSTSFYYYVYDSEQGQHIYSRTKEEHDRNVARVNGR